MSIYIQKPETVEAEQYVPGKSVPFDLVQLGSKKEGYCQGCKSPLSDHAWANPTGSVKLVCPGSYVVKTSKGYETFSSTDFQQKFEVV
jgi:hypothetical protein